MKFHFLSTIKKILIIKNYDFYRMDPSGIDLKLNRFGLNDALHYSSSTTQYPIGGDDDPGEIGRLVECVLLF